MRWARPIETFLKIVVTLWLAELFRQRHKMRGHVKTTAASC